MNSKRPDDRDPLDFSEFGAQAALRRGARDIAVALRFYTRLPLFGRAAQDHAAPDFKRMGWASPVAGAVVGLLGAAALALGAFIGLPALASAALSLAVMVLSTGAFHEDGLADTADSLGAYTTQTRLEVMRDSRVGAPSAPARWLSR